MKALHNFIILIGIVLLICSCNKESDVTEQISLVGSWTLISETNSGCNNQSENGTVSFNCTSDWCFRRTFSANGQYLLEDICCGSTGTISGTYTLLGSNITITENCQTCNPLRSYTIPIEITKMNLTMMFELDTSTGCKRTEVYKKE